MGAADLHLADISDLNFVLVRGAGANPDRCVDLPIKQGLENRR